MVYYYISVKWNVTFQLCKVILNAPAQAKQHYEGKNHARKLKMYLDNQEEILKKEQPTDPKVRHT